MKLDDNMAFESSDITDASMRLWRVHAMRPFKDCFIPHTNWFATEAASFEHIEYLRVHEACDITVTVYVRMNIITDLATMIARLCRCIPYGNPILRQALELLRKYNLIGSPLR